MRNLKTFYLLSKCSDASFKNSLFSLINVLKSTDFQVSSYFEMSEDSKHFEPFENGSLEQAQTQCVFQF